MAGVVKELFEKISATEAKTAELLTEVERLESCERPAAASDSSRLAELRTANAKLKYRLQHLQQSVAEEEARGMRGMTNVLSVISAVFSSAIRSVCPGVALKGLVQSSGGRFGDYKCMAAMPVSQFLKSKGENVPPKDVAARIIASLENHDRFIEKCEVAGPGFINISLKPSFVSELVSDVLVNGIRPPPVQRKLRVVVDFSSPNIAKEMHVGHLRSTIIGETICRLLEFLGHDVVRLSHVGDWGTQFGMLIAHLKETFPNYSEVSPPIGDLQSFYKESKVRFDNDEPFKKEAYADVVRLQNHDPKILKAWELICNVSRRECAEIYRRLGVTLKERGESFYQELMPGVVADLDNKKLTTVEEGRKLVFLPGKQVPPLTIEKSDGGYTYATSDITAARHRYEVEKADWLLYVVDAGQSTHLESVFQAARMAGYVSEETRIDHMAFGVVLGEDKKKFKTRSGDSVRLIDLLDEGMERALARLKEKNRDSVLTVDELATAQKSVAYGCIKYADLCHTRTNDYVFSFDKMLEDRGNTAVYLLYAYTRIRSIARLAQVSAEQLQEEAVSTTVDVSHDKELKLAKCISRFPEVVSRIADDLYPHTLCDYLYELCTSFTEFYDACYCVEKDRESGEVVRVHTSRLLLCEATARVLERGFFIVGLEPLSKM